MVDSNKLDTFFDNRQQFEAEKYAQPKRSVAWRRLFKITLPCIAAALLGLMVVMPNIKKSVEIKSDVTVPRKGEMEKLHIEQTEFNTVDSKNRVNKIVADHVDEIKAGSQKYKIRNPKGKIPTDNGFVDITSKTGYFNQKNNVLHLVEDVKAVIENDTVVTTTKATYDFNKEKGWGKEAVKAKGSWGTMDAEAFTYDKVAEILVLKGKNKINSTRGIMTADKETRVYQKENKTVSLGNAHIIRDQSNLYADKIIGWFGKNSKKDLERAEAYGNVVIQTPKETIKGGEGYYYANEGKIEMFADTKTAKNPRNLVSVKQGENTLQAKQVTVFVSKDGKNEVQKVVATGKVVVKTPEETISGEKGIYEPRQNKVEMFGSGVPVEIVQGENTLHAQKVEALLSKGSKQEIEQAIAIGEVEVLTPKGSAWGDKGIYNPQEHKVELFENVRIEQDGNFIIGAHAETDLETSVSRISGDDTTNGRISGTFYKKRK